MTSPVSGIEAIEKAMDEFDREVDDALSSESERADLWNDIEVSASDLREVLALARQAEALQRENVELREALEPFAAIADQLPIRSVGVPDHKPLWGYDGVELSYGDFRRARALLGGENAGN